MDFDSALDTFIARVQEHTTDRYVRDFPGLAPYKITVDKGRKFHRIVKTIDGGRGQRSVYCFVATQDSTTKALGTIKRGDILKSATWKQPARHVRGTIFSDTFDGYGVGDYGAHYLR